MQNECVLYVRKFVSLVRSVVLPLVLSHAMSSESQHRHSASFLRFQRSLTLFLAYQSSSMCVWVVCRQRRVRFRTVCACLHMCSRRSSASHCALRRPFQAISLSESMTLLMTYTLVLLVGLSVALAVCVGEVVVDRDRGRVSPRAVSAWLATWFACIVALVQINNTCSSNSLSFS